MIRLLGPSHSSLPSPMRRSPASGRSAPAGFRWGRPSRHPGRRPQNGRDGRAESQARRISRPRSGHDRERGGAPEARAEIAEIRTDRAKFNASLIETAAPHGSRRIASGAWRGACRPSRPARRRSGDPSIAARRHRGGPGGPAAHGPPAAAGRAGAAGGHARGHPHLDAARRRLPELRCEAETLAADLSELVRLKAAIVPDRAP